MIWRRVMFAVPNVDYVPNNVVDRLGRIVRGLQAELELFSPVYEPDIVRIHLPGGSGTRARGSPPGIGAIVELNVSVRKRQAVMSGDQNPCDHPALAFRCVMNSPASGSAFHTAGRKTARAAPQRSNTPSTPGSRDSTSSLSLLTAIGSRGVRTLMEISSASASSGDTGQKRGSALALTQALCHTS